MAAPIQHMADEEITVSLRAGSSIICVKPVFSHDSKYLLVCSQSIIKVYSTSSGECVHELKGHRDRVTSIVISCKNKLQLLSCALDNSVIQWDFTDGVLLKRFTVSQPLYGLYTLKKNTDQYLGLQKSTEKKFYDIVQFTLPNQHDAVVKAEVVKRRACKDSRCVAVGGKGSFVVTLRDRKMFIHSLDSDKSTVHQLEPNEKFTCVVCHPTIHCIATGTSDGKIYFWRNIYSPKAVKTLHHWHSLAVGDLTFTSEGSHLLSGGYECVLVKHQCLSQMNNCLPRLGAPITYVVCSENNLMYATCHSDNVIHVISNGLKLLQVYEGLTVANWVGGADQAIPTGLLCDPRSKAIVLNGKPGHLQFFSVETDKQLFNLDIVCQNYISPENLRRPTVVTQIERSAFDERGDWLATIEVWDDEELTPEIRLKFWHFVTKSQTYELNTTVELANQDRVHSLMFRPYSFTNKSRSNPMVVTTSSDGKFKLWSLVDDTDIYRENSRWTCESVGFFRDLPAGAASFSEDGSLLAVVFDYVVTLWDPASNVLKQSLTNQNMQDHVSHVCFGRRSSAHVLVSSTACQLTVWDLLSCSVLWSVDLNLILLTSDPRTELLAAITQEGDLFVFKPLEPKPVYCHPKISEHDIIGAVFVPQTKKSEYSENGPLSWQRESQLYFINNHQELLTLLMKWELEDTLKVRTVNANLPQTPFSQIISAEKKKREQPSMEDKDVTISVPSKSNFIRELLSTAAHVQPPVTSLCTRFIDALLLHKKGESETKEEEEEEKEEEEDVQMKQEIDSDADSDMEVSENKLVTDTDLEQTKSVVFDQDSVSDCVEQILGESFEWFADLVT